MLEMPVVSINVCLVKGRREGASSLGANLSDKVKEWRFILYAFFEYFLRLIRYFSFHLSSKELLCRLES